MASGGYDSSQQPSPASNTFRRTSSSTSYDVPSNAQGRRRSPSPAVSARRKSTPYDNYSAPRAGSSYRDEFPNSNNYRPDPNSWRPPPVRSSSTYYSRSPSPKSPEQNWHPSRISASWQAPASWPRRIPTPPPTPRDRLHRDTMAQAMSQTSFQPSDTWKKSHDRIEGPTSSPVSRFPAHRPPSRRPISPRNDYATSYYAPANSYRPPPPGAATHRDPQRADTYRPLYDDTSSWNQHISSEPSQPLSAGYKRDSGSPARNASRDARAYSFSPDPLRKSRQPRRLSRDSRKRDSRSRSRLISRRSSPYVPSEAMLTAFRGNRSAPRRIGSKSRSRSRSRSRSFSRSRSVSSSDVASTRASERSSREPPNKPTQKGPMPLSATPSSVKATVSLPSHSAAVSQQKKPAENTNISASQQQVSVSLSAKKTTQSINKTGDSAASKIQPPNSTTLSAPKLAIQTSFPINTVHPPPSATTATPKESISAQGKRPQPNLQSRSSESKVSKATSVVKASHTSKPAPPGTVPSILEPTGKSALVPKTATNKLSMSAGERQGKEPSLNFSSPLSSPDRTIKIEDLTKRDNGIVPTHPLSTKFAEMSETTTDDDENLPNLSDARSIADALRIVVMTRLRFDRQTRAERVNPVLKANHSIVQAIPPRPSTSSDDLFRELNQGVRRSSMLQNYYSIKQPLVKRFAKHQETLSDKTDRLREEYLALHERWQVHCAKLDNKTNKKTSKDAAATTEEVVIPAGSGRSTRRTAAMLGDAVRSDLEMEQIIASLGVEELTDPNHLALRNLANIPDMISVSHGDVNYLFDDTNNLVDNPIDFFDDSNSIDLWTDEEREIFLEQFAANPKQFGIIASFLPAKTAAQCVTYYYLNKKKHIDFRKVISLYAPGKRRRGGRRTDKQKGNALMADIRQHDDEVSLSHSGPTTRRKRGILPASTKSATPRLGTRLDLTPNSTPTPDPEPEVRKRGRRPNALARIASTLADEVDDDSTAIESKPSKKGRKVGRKPKNQTLVTEDPPTPSSTDGNLNESTTRRKVANVNVHWSDDDKSQFLNLLSQHGADFKRISASMPNKTTIQVNNFYKNNVVDLDLEKVAAGAPKRSPTPETVSEGWSKYPGSGIMSPVAGVETGAEGLSRTDIDRQLPVNGNVSLKKVRDLLRDPTSPSTLGSGSSGDLSGTSDRHSGLTEPAQHLVNMPNGSLQQQHQHHSQPQLHFSRFVPSERSAHFPLTPNPFAIFSSATFPSSRHPNHEVRVANRQETSVFREQSGLHPHDGVLSSGHNAHQGPH